MGIQNKNLSGSVTLEFGKTSSSPEHPNASHSWWASKEGLPLNFWHQTGGNNLYRSAELREGLFFPTWQLTSDSQANPQNTYLVQFVSKNIQSPLHIPILYGKSHSTAALIESFVADYNRILLSLSSDHNESASVATLQASVRTLLAEESLEIGLYHPLQRLLSSTLTKNLDTLSDLLVVLMQEGADSANDLAAVLVCLSRVEIPDNAASNLCKIGEDALKARQVEVRDGAVRLLETIGNNEAMKALKQHIEPVMWLRGYINAVLSTLT